MCIQKSKYNYISMRWKGHKKPSRWWAKCKWYHDTRYSHTWSPIHALTGLDTAQLRWSDENRCIQRSTAINTACKFYLDTNSRTRCCTGLHAHVCRYRVCFSGRGCQLSDYIPLDEKYSKMQTHQNLIQYIMILVLTIITLYVC